MINMTGLVGSVSTDMSARSSLIITMQYKMGASQETVYWPLWSMHILFLSHRYHLLHCSHHNIFITILDIFNVKLQSRNDHQCSQIIHQMKVKDLLVIYKLYKPYI